MRIIKSEKSVEISLAGDKNNPEKQTHVISFPGGHIEVTRTTNNNYWAHIYVNNKKYGGQLLEDVNSLSKEGTIEKIRFDTLDGVKTLLEETNHFAVLISTN